jgi:multiple sugar transport system permease protein
MVAKTPRNPQIRQKTITAYAFLSPTLVGFLIFVIGPMVAAIGLSLYQWNLIQPPVYVGLGNYQALFADVRLGKIYITTFVMAFMIVFSQMVLGLGIAVLLDLKMPALLKQFFRMAYFFPFVVSVTAVALIWSFLLNKDLGLVNYYLGLLGVRRIAWLNSSQWSPVAVVITDVWKNLGFYVLVYLGGLQGISTDYYEAAEVDGANAWNKFWNITLPLLSPTTLFLGVIGLINALQIFVQPRILTEGGPGDATRTVVMYIYEQGFRFFNMGYASTVALSLFVLILILTFLQFRLTRRYVFYQ